MNEYTPDRWLVVKLETEKETHYRVFATWAGGFAGSDSWQMNSGIVSVTLEDDYYCFKGFSGSLYACHKNAYGTFSYGQGVLNGMIERSKSKVAMSVMPKDTDWLAMKWETENV